MAYERRIDLEEVGVADCFELLLVHYRYSLEGDGGVRLIDEFGRMVATINCPDGEEAKLTIRSGGVWQEPYYYRLIGSFTERLRVKKVAKEIEEEKRQFHTRTYGLEITKKVEEFND